MAMDSEYLDRRMEDPDILREELARRMVHLLGYDGAVDYAKRNHYAGLLKDIVRVSCAV